MAGNGSGPGLGPDRGPGLGLGLVNFLGLGLGHRACVCRASIRTDISCAGGAGGGRAVTAARIAVRRAVPGDESVLRELRLEALAQAPEAFSSTYERELARTPADWRRWLAPGVALLLEDAGTPRGLVAGMYDATEPGIVHLVAMWVHPALRGSGAADALVSEHLAWARDAGARLVRLDVMRENERARRLYERHGFRLTGQEKVREADGRVELRMERPVAPAASPQPQGRDRSERDEAGG